MNRNDLIRTCVQNLLRRKSRTMLTVLGVVIGCCSIVVMASIGFGMRESQERLLSQMGDLTIITVTPPQKGRGKQQLDDALIAKLRSMRGVQAVTPKQELDGVSVSLQTGANGRFRTDWATVAGYDTAQLEAMGYRLKEGRWPKQKGEILVGQYFAYAFRDTLRPEGSDTIDRWSGEPDEDGNYSNPPDPYFSPLSQSVTLTAETETQSFPFTYKVVGVLKEDSSKGYETTEGILMTLSDLQDVLSKTQKPGTKKQGYGSLLVKTAALDAVAPTEKEIKTLGFPTDSMESIRKPMEEEARQKQLMLAGLGAVALVVAALGIANTMMTSISERTREIGIMKSLGCYVYDVRKLFLLEAAVIGFVGGLTGCFISFLVSTSINFFSLGPPAVENLLPAIVGGENISRVSVIPLWLYGFSILFSVLIGVGSGFYPANKAVRIPALEAIR